MTAEVSLAALIDRMRSDADDNEGQINGYWYAAALAPVVARLVAEAEQRGRREGAAEANAAAQEAVRRVREAHVPVHAYCVVCDRDRDVEGLGNEPDCPHFASFCRGCDYSWPCSTRRALDGAR